MAGTYHLTINQGATFTLPLTWNDDASAPIDITGYSAAMQIKTAVGGEIIATLSDVDNTIVPYVDGNGDAQEIESTAPGIVLGDAAGTVVITIDAAATEVMTFKRAVYDLELNDGNDVITRLLEGNVLLSKEVTI